MNKNSTIVAILTVLHFTGAVLGYLNYPGSLLSYLFFSITFYSCLLATYSRRNQASLLFLGAMFYLGFFVKIAMHLFLQTEFIEPIGNFRGTAEQWTEVLNVSSVGILGYVLCVILVKFKLDKNFQNLEYSKIYFKNLLIPKNLRTLFISLLFFGTSTIAFLNIYLGINLSGLTALTVLPWPTNAIIGWFLYIGFGLIGSHLLQVQYNNKKTISWPYYYLLFEGFVSSISIISRGLFLFHVIPIFYSTVLNRYKLSKSYVNLLKHFIIIFSLYFISSLTVSNLRGYYYNYDFSTNKNLSIFLSKNQIFGLNEESRAILSNLQRLFIDRWIGAEGVMSVSTYAEKNANLLLNSIFRFNIAGKQDIYNKISGSFYNLNEHYIFTSIPGPIATLYYSNSLIIVVLGLFLFSLLAILVETYIYFIFRNVFLNSFLGFYFANSIAQFGISPLPLIKSYIMTFAGIGLSYLYLNRKK